MLYVGSSDGRLYFIDRQSGVPRWTYRTPKAISTTPAIAAGMVFFGGEDRWFRAINAREMGTRWVYTWRWLHSAFFIWGVAGPLPQLPGFHWHFRADAPIVASAAVAHGMVYLASKSGTLSALDFHTGTPRWSFQAGAELYASPVLAGDALYVASYDHTLSVLNAHDGTQRWRFTAGGPIHASPVVSDGEVYVAAMDGTVSALR
jgi:outer membrane protein assembly factor BamB